ncbi:UNVERIFIED_CONTAM: hypothetical protein Sradi_0465100 [Sesamum radiatum]|uniref:Uncharacterized protein n=1 Tax=Sesamum radiatum TaxID=300843 RepID=A0AAW2W7I4_SESRA
MIVGQPTEYLDPSPLHVKQKKRYFCPEKDKVIQEEVSNKWRMCLDFRDVNKVYPKDFHPLSYIEQLVDSTSTDELLSQWMHSIAIIKSCLTPMTRRECHLSTIGKSHVWRATQMLQADHYIIDLAKTFGILKISHEAKPSKVCIWSLNWTLPRRMVIEKGIEVTKPLQCELLYLYLAVSQYAISFMFIKEEDKTENRSMVITTRKLCPYILPHSTPLRQMLGKAETSGKMIK